MGRADRPPGESPGGPDPPDEALARRVRGGDAAAFERLVERHMERAFSLAFRLLGHREDAEDLVQDAFIRLLERIDRYDPARPFGPWFYRLTANLALNARRARRLRSTDDLPRGLAVEVPGPAREAERADLRGRLAEAVQGLPERQRTIVQLFEVDGFSGPEIAAMLDISAGTVRWHLHEARRSLRRALESTHGGEP